MVENSVQKLLENRRAGFIVLSAVMVRHEEIRQTFRKLVQDWPAQDTLRVQWSSKGGGRRLRHMGERAWKTRRRSTSYVPGHLGMCLLSAAR